MRDVRPQRWQEIDNLFAAALEREPSERAAFLDEACAGDELLRKEVESLLANDTPESLVGDNAVQEVTRLLEKRAGELTSDRIGRYQIIRSLGVGGMGRVYLGRDEQLHRQVAVKLLSNYGAGEDERMRRFRREGLAASGLNHPNILTIYEIGEFEGANFITAEFVDGLTLRARMKAEAVTIDQALDIAIQISSALSAAHAAGIIHRDIKPENVMVRADGLVKVLDFGIAKITQPEGNEKEDLVETMPGAIIGTSHYMSPEQARGLPVDTRTDIWSLGIVLFEMVVGRLPFEGSTSADVIASILAREPTTLARYSPDAPTELEWIVKKALRKDRDERYQTAKEFLKDLKGLKQSLEFEQQVERSLDSGRESAELTSKAGSVSPENSTFQKSPGMEHKAIDSLAILPLVNNCADPNMEYLTDGITESMINALSKLTQLRVMAWSTVSQYKNKQVGPREAGRDLSVRAVLTGRVMQLGENLVIKTELVDAMDGSQLWAEQYSCKPSDLLDVEARLSREISEKLLIRLTTEERKGVTKRSTNNVEAYRLYLKGRYFWDKRTAQGARDAIEHFQQAIEKDPNYALAYTGLADTYCSLGRAGVLPLNETLPKAKAAAARALEIDDTLAEAHTSLANILFDDWDWARGEREVKRALQLKPSYSVARYSYSAFLAVMGRWAEAFAEIERALEIDPLSLVVNGHLSFMFYAARRYDEAIEHSLKMLKMDPNFVRARFCLGLAYAQKGDFNEAIATLEEAQRLTNTPQVLSALGVVYALSGERDKAQKMVTELKEGEERSYFSPYILAAVYASTGEKDEAFKYLRKACDVRSIELVGLNVNPVFDGIRSDPRFTDILSKIGLPSGSQPFILKF